MYNIFPFAWVLARHMWLTYPASSTRQRGQPPSRASARRRGRLGGVLRRPARPTRGPPASVVQALGDIASHVQSMAAPIHMRLLDLLATTLAGTPWAESCKPDPDEPIGNGTGGDGGERIAPMPR